MSRISYRFRITELATLSAGQNYWTMTESFCLRRPDLAKLRKCVPKQFVWPATDDLPSSSILN